MAELASPTDAWSSGASLIMSGVWLSASVDLPGMSTMSP
jgi:hypothetical protein